MPFDPTNSSGKQLHRHGASGDAVGPPWNGDEQAEVVLTMAGQLEAASGLGAMTAGDGGGENLYGLNGRVPTNCL